MKTYTDRQRAIKNEWLKKNPEVNRRHRLKSYYKKRLTLLQNEINLLQTEKNLLQKKLWNAGSITGFKQPDHDLLQKNAQIASSITRLEAKQAALLQKTGRKKGSITQETDETTPFDPASDSLLVQKIMEMYPSEGNYAERYNAAIALIKKHPALRVFAPT